MKAPFKQAWRLPLCSWCMTVPKSAGRRWMRGAAVPETLSKRVLLWNAQCACVSLRKGNKCTLHQSAAMSSTVSAFTSGLIKPKRPALSAGPLSLALRSVRTCRLWQLHHEKSVSQITNWVTFCWLLWLLISKILMELFRWKTDQESFLDDNLIRNYHAEEFLGVIVKGPLPVKDQSSSLKACKNPLEKSLEQSACRGTLTVCPHRRIVL